MTSNSSSSTTTGHAYRLRPMTTNPSSTSNSNLTGSSSNPGITNSNNSSYYGTSSAAPIVASPTWTYSSPSQLARKYANIAPIWCHITKPRQLKKKFASTFHQAQSLVGFYNEDRAPSERRSSLNQNQQQNSNQSQQQQQPPPSSVNNSSSNSHYHDSSGTSYRQPHSSYYTPHDHIIEPSTSSSSRSKKKYTGGALTMHIPSRLQSPPPPPISPLSLEEKFSNPTERKARIDQLKDLVFNTRVKDTMVGRTDSKNRSITNLHKATSFKRLDQITNPNDDHQQQSNIPPTTPTRKDSHYYHYHLPINTIASTVNENLNRPIVPPTSHSSYNYDYLRAKSKEHPRQNYHELNYPIYPSELPSSSSNSSNYVGSITNPSSTTNSSYRTFDDHGYISKPLSINEKNSSYSAITSYPTYQTPGSSKRRIKKYLLAKGTTGAGLSHQTEPIVTNFENISLLDEDKTIDGDHSNVVIANTHTLTPSSPPPPPPPPPSSLSSSTNIVPSLKTTVPIPPIPTLSPPPSPPPISTSNTTVESAVYSTPNAQLSPSPPNTNLTNPKLPPTIFIPLSASLTSLNNKHPQRQTSIKSTANSLLELIPSHAGKEQSPSRSIVPSIADDG